MLLSPRKTKYKKYRKGSIGKGNASTKIFLQFGTYGLKALTSNRVSAQQIEAARRAIIRKMKRLGKLWIRVYPDIPITQKATESRMGKGKGAVKYWVVKVKPGHILFEINGINAQIAIKALEYGKTKLPVRSKIITKQVYK